MAVSVNWGWSFLWCPCSQSPSFFGGLPLILGNSHLYYATTIPRVSVEGHARFLSPPGLIRCRTLRACYGLPGTTSCQYKLSLSLVFWTWSKKLGRIPIGADNKGRDIIQNRMNQTRPPRRPGRIQKVDPPDSELEVLLC